MSLIRGGRRWRTCLFAIAFPALLISSIPLLAQRLELSPFPDAARNPRWEGSQFIQADAHGNVFLLRGDTLEVYPITRPRELGKPMQLELGTVTGRLRHAAMSRRGDWLLVLGLADVHLFAAGRDEPLPRLGWAASTVGFVNNRPVVGAMPPRLLDTGDEHESGDPPLLLGVGHDSWSAGLSEPFHGSARDLGTEDAHRAVLVLDEVNGRFYLARQYAYRIELRRAGRGATLEELRLGDGKTIFRDNVSSQASQRRLEDQTKAEGVSTEKTTARAFRGVAALLALVNGPDGRLYAVVGPGIATRGCALDRIDWSSHRVERVQLSVACDGRMSAAAGRDGLYLAPYNGRNGSFFVSWSDIDAARWSVVPDAKFTP